MQAGLVGGRVQEDLAPGLHRGAVQDLEAAVVVVVAMDRIGGEGELELSLIHI